MSWFLVEDRIRGRRCFESQRYGTCGCRNKKGNPCERVKAFLQAAECHDQGLPAEFTVEEIAKFLLSKTCGLFRHDRSCNHKGCWESSRAIDFLEEMQRKVA